MVAVAQTRGIAPSLLVSPTEAVRTGPPPRHRRIVVSPSAAGLDTVVVPYNGRGLCNSLHGYEQSVSRCCLVTDAGARAAPIARRRTLAPRRGCRINPRNRLVVVGLSNGAG